MKFKRTHGGWYNGEYWIIRERCHVIGKPVYRLVKNAKIVSTHLRLWQAVESCSIRAGV